MQKTSHHRPQYDKRFSRYFISKLGIWGWWTSPFCRFLASFSLKYDVTDAILQDNKEMKVQYLRSLLFDCLKLCRLLELSKAFSLDFKFLTLKWDVSRIIWRTEVSDGSLFLFFGIFGALSFELNFFLPDRRFPLIQKLKHSFKKGSLILIWIQ